jgi:PBP1b-binding outer membrane lipoprotein LpoB
MVCPGDGARFPPREKSTVDYPAFSLRQGSKVRTTAILAIALLAVGCAHPGSVSSSSTPPTNTAASSDHSQAIESWRHSHRSAFSTLGQAMVDLGAAMNANDWNTIHTDCTRVAQATSAMRDALPSPDDKLNTILRSMLDNVETRMKQCPSLNATSDQIDANAFITEITNAENEITPGPEDMP